MRVVPLKDFQTGFVFHSNQGAPQGSRQGFVLNVRQIPCRSTGGTGTTVVATSGEPPYPPPPLPISGASFPHDPSVSVIRTDIRPPSLNRGGGTYPPQHQVHHGSGI